MVATDGLRLVRADNPSALTGTGTNTWILGRGTVAVIDPGPDDPRHLAAILGALAPGETVGAILVTHAHRDHSALAPALAAATGAPVCGYGPATAGRSAVMARLAAAGFAGGEEGLDAGFAPDRRLDEGDRVTLGPLTLGVLHTPGHFAGHLAFAWDKRLFCGDTAMSWATSLVSPPDGDMADYMATLARLAAGGWHQLLPGHGATIDDPAARLAELIAHRRAREAAIRAALEAGDDRLESITARVYADTPTALHPAAARNALAHLIALCETGEALAAPHPAPDARFTLARHAPA
jgi:hydroxyacylglutathione hydrolase